MFVCKQTLEAFKDGVSSEQGFYSVLDKSRENGSHPNISNK